IGGLQGAIVACGRVPSFIVTLGGFLVWRGMIFWYAQGQTMAPLDGTFQLLGGGPNGSLGEIGSWIVGGVGCAAIIFATVANRRRRQSYGFQVRPIWAMAVVTALACAAVLGGVLIANSYYWPDALARQYAQSH